MYLIWFIRKNIMVIIILFVPFLINLYIILKCLSYWRHVIIGFLLLAIGTFVSLLKPSRGEKAVHEIKREAG